MKRKVGNVTEQEKQEILALFERRNGLTELARILTPDNAELYEKLVADMGATGTRFQQWWDTTSARYGWESAPDGNWEIDFNTNDIYLVIPD
ncbi:MAG: CXXX repeat peptide modification system protein [Muribaculaceae bacterium]|nr:CXXX repeat peptide modification system protein [Muribaculaceae bacterium]